MSRSPSTSTRGTPSRRGVGRPRGGGLHSGSPTTPTPATGATIATPNSQKFFTSCLSIPVQGAKSIAGGQRSQSNPPPPVALEQAPAKSAAASGPSSGPSSGAPTSKRAPRKSKTDAMAALANHAGDDDGEDDERQRDGIAAIYGPDSDPIPVDAKLDLSSVKRSPPREEEPRVRDRPFGLEDCPTYRPSHDEFRDPMAFISKIAPEAREYGICKIVPPNGWSMPFVTDTEKFRFTTRVQRLNSIEAASRAKMTFLEQLYRYHHQVGNTRVAVPTINNKALDLWLLRKKVEESGGFETVNKARKWADLGRLLGYSGIPGLSTQIKNAYTRIILPFEEFHRHVLTSPALANVATAARDPNLHTHAPKPATTSGSGAAVTSAMDDDDPMSGLSDLDEPSSSKPSSHTRRSTRGASAELNAQIGKKPASKMASERPARLAGGDSDEESTEQACEICHKNDRGEDMLLCDGCDCGFHMFCLDPPLSTIPKGQWFCHTCLFGTGGDFGFDEGQEHSLSSFQARDLEFRKLWFSSHPPTRGLNASDPIAYKFGNVVVGENDVEEEFWRLVQTQNDTVEIEYGADVHSTTHGSASPTLETHPLNPYSKDPWNLNNMPILPESLLRFIKSDISGMTVPWTYVGMVFSTFCWHNEDHYTYSINFMHWGETKTWYGIPGDDAEKFEAAIRSEAPDLFEAQPDLLFQLVTLMNPQRLRDAGVRVYACNQRAGEFVITFPKAYHAGFNHGLNFNEAVNFALPDWLKYGRQCIQRYREHRKLPVFSHDELLITITQQSDSIATALWLKDSLREMMERERMNRRKGRALGLHDQLEEEDRPEDQYQCAICKVFCYLSQITCGCTNKIVCVDHAEQLCTCDMDQHALRLRFSDAELEATFSKVEERANQPLSWQRRLDAQLAGSARPHLRHLRSLVADGERINHKISELPTLAKFVARANQWVDAANVFLLKPSSKSRRRNEAGVGGDTVVEKPTKALAELRALLEEVETLGFDAPEIAALRAIAATADDVQERARELLEEDRQAPSFLKTCESLLVDASALNVRIPEIIEVEKIVGAREVIRQLEDEVEKNAMTLDQVSALLNRARVLGIPQDNQHVRTLQQRQRNGQSWDERASHVLAQPYKTIEELSEFVDLDQGTLINPVTYDNILRSLKHAKEHDEQARRWLANRPECERPAPSEVLKLVNSVEKEFSIPSIKEIKRLADFAADLESRCDQVLVNRYQHHDVDDIFDVMYKWVDYAKQHLPMFSLPRFEELDEQLTEHVRWLEHIPWRGTAPEHAKQVYSEVLKATRPEDEIPPEDEFLTCICDDPVRPPQPGSTNEAVQCDHCFARFHGKCARSGGSCPFCDVHHWDGSIMRHKERPYDFCYMPGLLAHAPAITRHYSDDWRNFETVVHRIERLGSQIGQLLAYINQERNHRREYVGLVRHYMRKLYKIQFSVSPSLDSNYGLQLAKLHRDLASLPSNQRAKKRRRPKFTFGQDIDVDWHDNTRCICRGRTGYLLGYPTVRCEQCSKLYHSGCVFYPAERPPGQSYVEYVCPLCCLRKNRPYNYAELRVRDPSNPNPQQYVDTARMLDHFSKDIIYKTLPEPYTHTLFVELVRFVPGQPDIIVGHSHMTPVSAPPSSNGHRPRAPMPTPAPPAAPPSAPPPPVPPPPWQQGPWVSAPVATPPAGPQPSHRIISIGGSQSEPPHRPVTPPSTKRKRGDEDEGPSSVEAGYSPAHQAKRRHTVGAAVSTEQPSLKRNHDDEVQGPSNSAHSPSHASKRRNTADGLAPERVPIGSPQTPATAPRQTPTLSPSLAMIMSPQMSHSPGRVYISTNHASPSRPGAHAASPGGVSHPSPRVLHQSPTLSNGLHQSPTISNGAAHASPSIAHSPPSHGLPPISTMPR